MLTMVVWSFRPRLLLLLLILFICPVVHLEFLEMIRDAYTARMQPSWELLDLGNGPRLCFWVLSQRTWCFDRFTRLTDGLRSLYSRFSSDLVSYRLPLSMLALFLQRMLLHCSALLCLGLLLHLDFVNKLLGLLCVHFGPVCVFRDLLCLLLPLDLLSFLLIILLLFPSCTILHLVSLLVVINLCVILRLPLFSFVSNLIILLLDLFHGLFLLFLLHFLDEISFLLLSHTFLARGESPVGFGFWTDIRLEQV